MNRLQFCNNEGIITIRFLLMNYVSKIFFTSYTYILHLANVLSSKCLELENFPWVTLYIFANRIAIIGEITTFLCMSFSKVILNWRADIYVKLNNPISVNLATLLVVLVNVIDMLIRFDMHVLDDCGDSLVFKIYQVEFQRKFCLPEGYNYTSNLTVCEIYKQAENVKSIGCKVCPSNPTLRIILGLVLLLEIIKFLLGFARIAKKYGKKLGFYKTSNSTSGHSTQTKQTIISNNKVEPISTNCQVEQNSAVTKLTVIENEPSKMKVSKDSDSRITGKEIITVQAEINENFQTNDELKRGQSPEPATKEHTEKVESLQIEQFGDTCEMPNPIDQSAESFEMPKPEEQVVEKEIFELKRLDIESDPNNPIEQLEENQMPKPHDLSNQALELTSQPIAQEIVTDHERKTEKDKIILLENKKRYFPLLDNLRSFIPTLADRISYYIPIFI